VRGAICWRCGEPGIEGGRHDGACEGCTRILIARNALVVGEQGQPIAGEKPVNSAVLELERFQSETVREDGTGPKARRLRRQTLASVEARAVRWLVPGMIPLRTLTLVAGEGGLGKSTWLAGVAARLTLGQFACGPADVLLVTFEDPAAEVLRPRVQAAEGDLSRVHVVTVETQDAESLVCLPRDVAELERHITETGARLVVIDPIVAALDVNLDSHKDQHVRLALGQLAKLAEATESAVALVGHLNKNPSTDAYLRVANSVAFWNAARSVVLVTQDGSDPESGRLIAQRKSNYMRLCRVERHRIEEIRLPDLDPVDGQPIVTARMAFVEIAEDVDGSDVLVSRASGDTKQSKAVAFVAVVLGDGDWHESAAVKQRAGDEEQLAKRTVERAAETLNVEARSEGFPRRTFWRLPSRASVVPTAFGATENDNADPHGSTDSAGAAVPVAPVAPVAPTGDGAGTGTDPHPDPADYLPDRAWLKTAPMAELRAVYEEAKEPAP
jgi:AAA domain